MLRQLVVVIKSNLGARRLNTVHKKPASLFGRNAQLAARRIRPGRSRSAQWMLFDHCERRERRGETRAGGRENPGEDGGEVGLEDYGPLFGEARQRFERLTPSP